MANGPMSPNYITCLLSHQRTEEWQFRKGVLEAVNPLTTQILGECISLNVIEPCNYDFH